VLVLNPAELLEQSRDSTRVSDLTTLNSALSLYLTDVTSPDMNGPLQANGECSSEQYVYADVTTNSFSVGLATESISSSRLVDGGGWLPVNFTGISGGSPLGTLPADPTNSGDLVYRYACDNTAKTYEVNAQFESDKYMTALDLDAKDGGNNATFYEVGNAPGLAL